MIANGDMIFFQEIYQKILQITNKVKILNGTVYDVSVDYNWIEKENSLNIQEYLMVSNNIK